ncbi:MAG TPA: RND transporter [Gammaproteobacteria bacterium]|nr:RND transporter [Gammaproteobacteria bacterium]
MWTWLDKIPVLPLLVGALLLGAAPFVPEPHLVEKLRMLLTGELARPIDVFDLFLHGILPLLLLLKLGRMAAARSG